MKQIHYPKGLHVVAALALLLPRLSVAQPNHERVIEQLDTDGDNLISYEEFEPPRQRGRDRFEGGDTDGDGNLSREEVEAQLAKQIDEMTARAIERFEAADLNGDGLVSAEERKRAGFDRIDADGDGYISGDELEAAHRARRDHHRLPPKG